MPHITTKNIRSLLAIAAAILIGLALWRIIDAPTAAIKQINLNYEVVSQPAERQTGLSGRAVLSPDDAMLFVFDSDQQHGIWMKDMLFAIDIVWLNKNSEVVHVEHGVKPSSYPEVFKPPVSARYVVEVAAGTASRLGLQNGDVLDLST